MSIPLKLYDYQSLFDEHDGRPDGSRALAPAVLETMTSIYREQEILNRKKPIHVVVILSFETALTAEQIQSARRHFGQIFSNYRSRTRIFMRTYARKFIVWLTMAMVLFGFSMIMERKGRQDFIYTVLGIVIWILIDNIVETFFMDNEGKRNAIMLHRFSTAEVVIDAQRAIEPKKADQL